MEAARDDQLMAIERRWRDLSWLGRQLFSRRIEGSGLTVPQYTVLQAIARAGGAATMSAVAAELQLPPSSLTSIADRLEQGGLIERCRPAADRRAVLATITRGGRALVRAVERAQHEDLAAMLTDATDEELAVFRGVLERLLRGVERALSEPASVAPAVVAARGD